MIERREISVPNTDKNGADAATEQAKQDDVRPKRAKKVTPSGMAKPEMVKQREANSETQPAHEPATKPTQEVRPRPKFETEFTRLTNYIHVERLARIRRLQASGEIGSLTRLIDAGLKEYLDRHFPQQR